jgi:sugar/nucleoside kinase (ribokinase family)
MRKRPLDCLIAGEACMDLIMSGTQEFETGKEKLVDSMNLVLGGSSAITAFNLACLGARVAFVGVIGNDIFGDFIVQKLSGVKMNLEGLRRTPENQTGLTLWYSKKGARAGLTYSGTMAMLRASDVGVQRLQQARHLHVGHYFLLKKLHSGAPALFRRARSLGLTTSLDCNHDPANDWQSGIERVLQHTDIFFPNDAEARSLTGCRTEEAAARELGKLARIVCVKCGPRGVLVYSQEQLLRMAAVKTQVVDTTGAGDSFNAGFLSRFLLGAAVPDCARAGLKAAARCVTAVGGTAAFEAKCRP